MGIGTRQGHSRPGLPAVGQPTTRCLLPPDNPTGLTTQVRQGHGSPHVGGSLPGSGLHPNLAMWSSNPGLPNVA